jgi:hypothetical protein
MKKLWRKSETFKILIYVTLTFILFIIGMIQYPMLILLLGLICLTGNIVYLTVLKIKEEINR